jgi:hypothetical protein
MNWTKPVPELVDRFLAALPEHPDAERKKMFGFPACFVNGNYFAGLHQEAFVIRLPAPLKDRFSELAGSEQFDPRATGKGMKDWWLIPPDVVEDETRLTALLHSAFEDVRKLPPKEKRPSARRSRK